MIKTKLFRFDKNFTIIFFNEKANRKSYYYLIELLFADFKIERLLRVFEWSCCKRTHTIDCIMKWSFMKKYLKYYFLKENGV